MNQSTLISLAPSELKDLIKASVTEALGGTVLEDTRLTQKEAAKYLEVSEPTLIDWKKKGIIPFHQFPRTRSIYYLKSELDQAAKVRVEAQD